MQCGVDFSRRFVYNKGNTAQLRRRASPNLLAELCGVALKQGVSPEKEGPSFCVKGTGCLRRPYLFSRGRKDMEEKTVRTRNRAYAPEKSIRYVVRFVVTLTVVVTPFGRPSNRGNRAHDTQCGSLCLRPLNIGRMGFAEHAIFLYAKSKAPPGGRRFSCSYAALSNRSP